MRSAASHFCSLLFSTFAIGHGHQESVEFYIGGSPSCCPGLQGHGGTPTSVFWGAEFVALPSKGFCASDIRWVKLRCDKSLKQGTILDLLDLVDTELQGQITSALDAHRGTAKPVTAKSVNNIAARPDSTANLLQTQPEAEEAAASFLTPVVGSFWKWPENYCLATLSPTHLQFLRERRFPYLIWSNRWWLPLAFLLCYVCFEYGTAWRHCMKSFT